MRFIDISRDLLTAPVYPGDPEPSVEHFYSIKGGDDCNLSAVYACVHTGTHADAPLHFMLSTDTCKTSHIKHFSAGGSLRLQG